MSLQSEYIIYILIYNTIQSLLTDKHFLNSPASLVIDSLEGLCALNPRLALDVQNKSEMPKKICLHWFICKY